MTTARTSSSPSLSLPRAAAATARRRRRATAPAVAALALATTLGGTLTACAAVRAPSARATTTTAATATSARAATVTAAGARTLPAVGCRSTTPAVRPTHVPISCGDGSAFAVHVRWRSLTTAKGSAMGVVLLDDCVPNCAEGHYRAYAARLDFTRVRTVAHRPVFTRLAITFTTRHPSGHRTMAAAY